MHRHEDGRLLNMLRRSAVRRTAMVVVASRFLVVPGQVGGCPFNGVPKRVSFNNLPEPSTVRLAETVSLVVKITVIEAGNGAPVTGILELMKSSRVICAIIRRRALSYLRHERANSSRAIS